MIIKDIAGAKRLISAAFTVATRFESSGDELKLAMGSLVQKNGCMCSLGHLLKEVGVEDLSRNWVIPLSKTLGVYPVDGAYDDNMHEVDQMAERIWVANDRSGGSKQHAAGALRAFARELLEELKKVEVEA